MKPTSDICDEHGEVAQVCEPVFRDFGGLEAFEGPIVTLRTLEDNSKVRRILSEAGEGRVLVIDGGGALTCGLLGGHLGRLAEINGWSGVLVNGCVRDAAELAKCRIGLKALAAHPRKSRQADAGERDVVLEFAGAAFNPGCYVVADRDGIVVLEAPP